MPTLHNLRSHLDKIDVDLARLLRLRAKFVIKIGKLKKSQKLALIDPAREKEIMKNLNGDYETAIFKKIISESRKIQKTHPGNL